MNKITVLRLAALLLAPLAGLHAADAPAKAACKSNQTQAAAYYFPNWHRQAG